jgi:hypothetical protein
MFIQIREGFMPQVPLTIQKAVFRLAAFIARATGVEKLAKYYR